MEPELRETFESAQCVLGQAQTGKTQALLERAGSFAQMGHDVLLVCACPAGAADACERLDRALGSERERIRVCLARDIAVEILGQPEAYERLQRTPRVLEHFEEQMLFEDIRTTGFPGKRLAAVFRYLKAGWSRMADDDEDWLITLEEEAVASTVRQTLRFTGGVLASELGNLSLNALRACPALRSRHDAHAVLVDDYPLLDRASQLLARTLARSHFGFSADETPSLAALAEFPCPEGADEFLLDHPGTQIERLGTSALPRDIAALIARSAEVERRVEAEERALDLQRADGEGPQRESDSVHVSMEADMAVELRTIAGICQQAVEAGDNAIVVGNDELWCANAYRHLHEAGLAVTYGKRRVSVKDFRDEHSRAAICRASMQRLREHPHDGVAWRSLIGCGDYLARSNAVQELREVAQPRGLNIEEALGQLELGQLEGIDSNEARFGPLREIYRDVRKELGEQRKPAARSTMATSRTAARSTRTSRDKDPARDEQHAGSVLIARPDEVLGLRAPVVIFGGFVNGCIPSRGFLDGTSLLGAARRRAQVHDLRSIRCVAGCATRALHLTGFRSCSLHAAERMELHIARIELRGGLRTCSIEPSAYLALLDA